MGVARLDLEEGAVGVPCHALDRRRSAARIVGAGTAAGHLTGEGGVRVGLVVAPKF